MASMACDGRGRVSSGFTFDIFGLTVDSGPTVLYIVHSKSGRKEGGGGGIKPDRKKAIYPNPDKKKCEQLDLSVRKSTNLDIESDIT